jgi:hypothetical protein
MRDMLEPIKRQAESVTQELRQAARAKPLAFVVLTRAQSATLSKALRSQIELLRLDLELNDGDAAVARSECATLETLLAAVHLGIAIIAEEVR